jgi:plasmid stabilization system protein ParE
MYAVILSDAAQTDLDNIVRYIAVDNPTAAEKLGLDLIEGRRPLRHGELPLDQS